MPRRTALSGKLTKLCCVTVGIGGFLTVDLTRAGPPFVTDDPEPPPPGGWEINVPLMIEHASGSTEMDAPSFDLNYGLPNVQLKLEFPIQVIQEDHSETTAGLGDLLLGVKWRLLNNEQSKFQVGVYPQLLVPTGDHWRGLGEGQPGFVLPLLAQKSWDKWTLYGNVGFWWRSAPESRDYFYSGAVLEREITERFELGVEVFGNSPKERGGRSDVGFNIGGTWKLSDHFNLLFSAGRDIVGDAHVMAYIGVQLLTK